jgi:hypothetical protein
MAPTYGVKQPQSWQLFLQGVRENKAQRAGGSLSSSLLFALGTMNHPLWWWGTCLFVAKVQVQHLMSQFEVKGL